MIGQMELIFHVTKEKNFKVQRNFNANTFRAPFFKSKKEDNTVKLRNNLRSFVAASFKRDDFRPHWEWKS